MLSRRLFIQIICAASCAVPLSSLARAQEERSFALQFAVLGGTDREATEALAVIRSENRSDLIAGLILATRFNRRRAAQISDTLAVLTSDHKADDWFTWMLWQEAHPEIIPHPSYADLKRDTYLQIDPDFALFLQPQYLLRDRMRIRLEEITWGGVVKDGIPSLDNPKLIAPSQADWMKPDDLVFGVEINGDARAYPLRIMGWHEMFNEVIGGVPVALAYCTLCGSGILFETRLANRDKPFSFGSSGFLYRSNKLMYDRQTNSLWNQFTGEPVVGPLANSGLKLVQRPVVITSWAHWRKANPQTRILSIDTGFRRNYDSVVVYREYFASPDLMFPTVADQSRQGQKDYVFGIRRFGGAKAWPLKAFVTRPVINDTVADFPVVLIGDAANRTVRAYERGENVFNQSGDEIVSTDGTVWTVGEDALVSSHGARLSRQAGHVAYWFAWDGYLGAKSELYTE